MTSRRLSLFAAMPALSAIVLVSVPCHRSLADYQSAREAYLRGDFATAFELALPSALEGDPKSRIGLGLMLARGQGVKADIVRSYTWFDMAAMQAEPEYRLARILALANRDYLQKQMSADQLAQARLRTAMMQATPEAIAEPSPFGFSLASDATKNGFPVERTSATVNGAATALAATASQVPIALLHSTMVPSRIQLAALPAGSANRLRAEWSRLKSRYAVLGKLQPSLIRMDLGDFGVYEGLRAGPFYSTRQANATCSALIESGEDCLVVAR